MNILSPLAIVDPMIVEFLVIVDRFSGPIVYFSMYFSLNSGITRYSGHFATDRQIHYYKRRLYDFFSSLRKCLLKVWYLFVYLEYSNKNYNLFFIRNIQPKTCIAAHQSIWGSGAMNFKRIEKPQNAMQV